MDSSREEMGKRKKLIPKAGMGVDRLKRGPSLELRCGKKGRRVARLGGRKETPSSSVGLLEDGHLFKEARGGVPRVGLSFPLSTVRKPQIKVDLRTGGSVQGGLADAVNCL